MDSELCIDFQKKSKLVPEITESRHFNQILETRNECVAYTIALGATMENIFLKIGKFLNSHEEKISTTN